MICSPKHVQAVLLKSLSFTEEDIIPVLKSCNSPKEDNKALIAPRNCGKMVLQHSLSFKNWQLDENKLGITVSFKLQSPKGTQFCEVAPQSETKSPKPLNYSMIASSPRPLSELDEAATKLQKVYKSYRTRRNLADCAVVVEELWWKALDFASLKRSSVSFFNVERQETAVSRWARARTRAAKVGKGLSKDDKAQKLALQHWLEAIDPRHRYGHNLHLYYDVWFESESSQPFFYWLDIGDGKEVNLEVCPRNKLQHQCIKYLGPKERETYEVVVTDGKLIYRQSQTLVNTTDGTKWIFVLSTTRNLYIGEKKKGTFQHSSFLSGGATTAAGRLVAKDGDLKAIWPYSGHYHPTEENFKEFLCFLKENNVDLTNVKKCSVDDDEFPSFRKLKTEEKDINVEPLEANKAKNISTLTETNHSSKPKQLDMKIIERAEEQAFEFRNFMNSKWTSGAGPRIGCVRDYPANLQSMALEQVNLSPRLIPSPQGNKSPIPSPRPSPKMRLSPRIACMGFPTPTVSLKLPPNLKK